MHYVQEDQVKTGSGRHVVLPASLPAGFLALRTAATKTAMLETAIPHRDRPHSTLSTTG